MIDVRLSIVCREIDKNTGAVATYLCKNDISENDLKFFQLRSVFNPELPYYSILTRIAEDPESLDDVLRFLKRRNISESAIKRYGGIVEL